MIPTRMRPKYNLWELYKDIGQSEKAIEIANAILAMELKIVQYPYIIPKDCI